MTALEMFQGIEASGLWNYGDEPYFAWQGCDYCRARTGEQLGNTVYDCSGYVSLGGAQKDELYEFTLCGSCINAIANGEPFDEE